MGFKGRQFECAVRRIGKLHAFPDGIGSDPDAPHRALTGLNRASSDRLNLAPRFIEKSCREGAVIGRLN